MPTNVALVYVLQYMCVCACVCVCVCVCVIQYYFMHCIGLANNTNIKVNPV